MTTSTRINYILDDPRLKQGRKSFDEKNFENAIDLLASLLESTNEQFGELSVESALAYFEYGNALLTKEEENPSSDLLGNVNKNEKGEAGATGPLEDEEVGSESEDEGEEEGEGEAANDDLEGDLQIAWEVLDVARSIFEKEKENSSEAENYLAEVYVRLGDLQRLNNNVSEAIQEYSKALAIRKATCQPHDRLLSDVYFFLAVAHIHLSGEKLVESVKPLDEKKTALTYYQLSREVLQRWLVLGTDGPKGATLSDVTEFVEILTETIDALVLEIKEIETPAVSKKLSDASQPVTTIGFGSSNNSSSSSKPPASLLTKRPEGKTAANSNTSNSNTATATAAGGEPVLQVKKKRKTDESH